MKKGFSVVLSFVMILSLFGWQLYARVQSSGNFVCMIVLPEGYTIPENVFEL